MEQAETDKEAKLFNLAIVHLMKTKLNADRPEIETRKCLNMDAMLCGVIISRLELYEFLNSLEGENGNTN